MKKYFKYYLAAWALFFIVYNVIVFAVVPNFVPAFEVGDTTYGFGKYEGSFWPGYIAIVIAFLGNLICTLKFFKSESLDKAFLNMPLFRISWGCIIVTMIIATLTMLYMDLPNWIGALVCILVLFFYIFALIKASAASEAVSEVEAKVEAKTALMKLMTAEAEGLLGRATNENIRSECKKVYEALRYSDPMTNNALSGIDAEISNAIDSLTEAVKKEEEDNVADLAGKICNLVNDRNVRCKALK